MLIYLAGPITGIENLNYPAFHEASTALRSQGHGVLNPREQPISDAKTWADYMRICLRWLMDCEAIAVLPGWKASKGARVEVTVAARLEMPVLDALTLEPIDPMDIPEII